MGEFFVYSLFVGTLLFLFPIFVNTDSYLDVLENKAWFTVSLYGFLPVVGGYAELRKDGVAVHLTDKFAAFIPYGQMADTRKKFEITKGFQLYRFHQIVETGGAESAYGVILAGLLQSAGGATFSVLRTLHPFLSLKNGTVLADYPCIKLTIRTTVIFNGLVLTIAFAKKALEAIINWIRKRKSTASWKRQPSSS